MEVVDPQLEKAMSVTAPQREKAAEVVAQYWTKIDDAAMRPARKVCIVCACVCVYLTKLHATSAAPVVSPDGFYCNDDCVMYTVGVESV